MTMLPHSDACERNKEPILEVLKEAFAACTHVLEIGSGTGQHAVHFALAMPGLVWQPSELPDGMPALRKRIFNEGPSNLRAPVALDVAATTWDVRAVDGIFTANTLHIMHWPQVEALFAGLPAVAKPGAVLAIYGPFRYGGRHTSVSNESFDELLRAHDPAPASATSRRSTRSRAARDLRLPGLPDAGQQPDDRLASHASRLERGFQHHQREADDRRQRRHGPPEVPLLRQPVVGGAVEVPTRRFRPGRSRACAAAMA